jgi:hypothetical protein
VERTDVFRLALASDSVNGPLIGVVTSGTVALVKEGSLSARWTVEYTGAAAMITLGSAASGGPLIGIESSPGAPLVKQGSLSAAWTTEYPSLVEYLEVAG